MWSIAAVAAVVQGASQVMVDNGFKHVINMQGGIMSWTGKLVKKP